MEKRRILYVEDNKDTFEMTQILLSDYDFTYAKTKTEAIDLARIGGFVLILLDYWLSDGTGDEACRLIRGFDSKVPILFITASRAFTETHARSIGAQGTLRKMSPNFNEELQQRVSDLTQI